MQLEFALLRMEKSAHDPARLLLENPRVAIMHLALLKAEPIDRLLHRLAERHADELAQGGQARTAGRERKAIFQRASDQINVARMRVEIAHEFLQP